MVHYCMLANQPKLELKGMEGGKIQMELSKSSPLAAAKDIHMHALDLSTPAPDQLVQEWTCFKDGKPNGVTVFTLKKE